MAKVIVLAGGSSDEREISLRSGAAVAEALGEAGHSVTMLDPATGLDGLLPELKRGDVVFPALHGIGGEDGTLQRFLEAQRIAYVGPGSRASKLCFNKFHYCELLRGSNILIPRTVLVDFKAFERSALSKEPFVLKPNDGGSSIDTFIVRNVSQLDEAPIRAAFERHSKLLLQELISGTEITVAMLGETALPVIEIIPPADGEFDYENKYNGQTRELCPPEHVTKSIQQKAQLLAKEIHFLTGCRDMSRTDIIVTPHDELYVLETNTIPGLTGESLLPRAAKVAGYSMPELCDRLVQSALQRNT